jgi:hypothetical protein
MSRLPLPVAAFVVLGSMKSALAGAEESYVLSYQGTAGCPSDDSVRADVAAHVHDASRAAGARVELQIAAEGTAFSGELVAIDAAGRQGRRRIRGHTCAEVAHALAFLAGFAIELGGRMEPDASEPPVPATPAPLTPLPAPSLGIREAPARPPWAIILVALGEARGGLAPIPRPSAAIGLDVGERTDALFSPTGRIALDVGSGHLEGAQGSANLSLLCARLEVCPLRFGGSAFAVRPCVGTELGGVHAQSSAPVAPRNSIEPWGSAEVTLRVQWLVTQRLFVEVGAGPSASLFRTRYFFEPNHTLYVVPPVTGRGALGFGLRL